MAKYLQLQIPNACHESWQNMTAQHNGRFCQSCQKSVIDFTTMTDEEIARFFKEQKGNTCGRFTSEQLDRDIRMPRRPFPLIKYFFRYSLPAFLLMLKGNVQAQLFPAKVEVTPLKIKSPANDMTLPKKTIRGFVTDEQGKPLPFATVGIKDERIMTATDTAGYYELPGITLPANLQVSYIGYLQKEILVTSEVKNINLEMSMAIMGDVIVGGYVTVKARRKKSNKILAHKRQDVQVCEKTPAITVYPNPVKSNSTVNIQCSTLETGNYHVELYSLSGQLLQSISISYSGNDKNMSMKIGHVSPGLYNIRLVHDKSGKQVSQKIMVQE